MTFHREPIGLKQPRIISQAIRKSAQGIIEAADRAEAGE